MTSLRISLDVRRPPGAYAAIENALYDAATAVAANGHKIRVVARGNAALPLGVLFGAVYSPFVFDLVWKQSAPGMPTEDWSLMSDVAPVATTVRNAKGNLNSEDLLLALSINADVERAAAEYLRTKSLSPRATISVGLAQGPLQRGQKISPQQGLRVAHDTIDAARNLKDQLRMNRANLHLFLALPAELGCSHRAEPQHFRRLYRLRALQRPSAFLCARAPVQAVEFHVLLNFYGSQATKRWHCGGRR